MTDVHAVARDQLRSFIERIERLEEEKKAIADDIKDVKGEAKGLGFDVGAINAIVKLRKKDANERAEEEAILDAYMAALGMIDQPSFFDEPHDRETGELSPRLAKQVVDDMQTETGRAALMAAVDILIEREEAEEQNAPERPSHNDEPSPEAGPQAEASPAGTGAGTFADREGRHEGEAASADLPTNQPETATSSMAARKDVPLATAEDGRHLVGNEKCQDKREEASHRQAGTQALSVDSNHELATASQGEAEAPSAERVSPRSETDTGSAAANTGGDHVDDHQSAATSAGALVNKAPATRLLRPHCQRPEMCGSGTRDHCWNCKKAIREGEAA